ncbi:NAD-dependent protein deacetylase [Variovorax dokdonensis]|uniref:NAD-dependent protein deacetylase n=1 Tax=Variovorax dokdonensis TaxID=344883 RepID=A0ABT7N595_9BURK|nr:NAD-dependent protein deacetylase [Variovorax dokdonensis]MDM0043124.1 NAD-dependent protein deacetylase [Variovorax dokdonensis]
MQTDAAIDALTDFVQRHRRLFVLTGAGVSTESGIPDYRDDKGYWKRPEPVRYQDFMGSQAVRQRYWACSMIGWPVMANARPGAAHLALARLEARDRVRLLLTQNVDGLHRAAGSASPVELHGRIDTVVCMECRRTLPRAEFQEQLESRNPDWVALEARAAPDGDADLHGLDFSQFFVPPCPHCGGILKPDVVFFGESVPPDRVAAARAALADSDAMLVVGSSLMVYSGFRFAQAAAAASLPIAALNLGRTRADDLLALKVQAPAGAALAAVVDRLNA